MTEQIDEDFPYLPLPSFIEDSPGDADAKAFGWEYYYKYQDVYDHTKTWRIVVHEISFAVFVFFFTYHVISKLRGNEKNTKMNNQAIFLSFIGLFNYAVYTMVRFKLGTKYIGSYSNRRTRYLTIRWASDLSIVMIHVLFTLNYVRTTLKLPPLIEITKVYCEVIEKIPERELKMEPLTTPQELEETQ